MLDFIVSTKETSGTVHFSIEVIDVKTLWYLVERSLVLANAYSLQFTEQRHIAFLAVDLDHVLDVARQGPAVNRLKVF